MAKLVDNACLWQKKTEFLFFFEFPIFGYCPKIHMHRTGDCGNLHETSDLFDQSVGRVSMALKLSSPGTIAPSCGGCAPERTWMQGYHLIWHLHLFWRVAFLCFSVPFERQTLKERLIWWQNREINGLRKHVGCQFVFANILFFKDQMSGGFSGRQCTLDSLSTKRKLQRKLKPNVTEILWPMTDEGVANSAHLIGFHN